MLVLIKASPTQMVQKLILLLCIGLIPLWLQGQETTLPTDTTTFYTDTTCYIKPVQVVVNDTVGKAYLLRIATLKLLVEQSLHKTADSLALSNSPPPSTDILFAVADSLVEALPPPLPPPPQLWHNIQGLPEITGADIETTLILQPLRTPPKTKTFLFYIFLGIAFIYAYLLNSYTKYIDKLREAVFNIYIARQFYKDFNHSNFVLNAILFFLPIAIFGLFVYLTATFFGKMTQVNDLLLLGVLVTGVGIYLVLHRIILVFLAIILPISESIHFFLFNTRMINVVFSIFLLPVLLFLAFGSIWIQTIALYMSGLNIILFIGFIYYRGISIVKEFIWTYKFHFFLYLCGLEIAPVLVLVKVAAKYLT